MPPSVDNALAFEEVMEKLSAAKKTRAGQPSVLDPLKPIAPITPTVLKIGKLTKEELAQTKTTELDLWKKWKTGGEKPEDLDPLLKSFDRMIQLRASTFKNRVEIPNEAIDFEHKNAVVKALRSFDPKKGAALGTHVSNRLSQTPVRFIKTNQNFARIVEPLSERIGDFNRLRSDLAERLGHEPDAQTMHDHLLTEDHPFERLRGMSLKDIKRLNTEQRKTTIRTGLGEDALNAFSTSSRNQEVVLLIQPQLTELERKVHELTFGLNGEPALKPGEIAKRLKLDNSKVSKLRTSIFNKMKPHLGDS